MLIDVQSQMEIFDFFAGNKMFDTDQLNDFPNDDENDNEGDENKIMFRKCRRNFGQFLQFDALCKLYKGHFNKDKIFKDF